MKKKLTRKDAALLYERLRALNPDPRTELEFRDPYTLLVAVVLSAQATDKSVNIATRGLFAAAATPQAMVDLGEEGVARHIRTIGLWRNKAKNVVALSAALIANHGGETPRERAALEALPGVGRKTANVVLSEAFGETTLAVDTHVFRVARRTGLASGATPDAVEAEVVKLTPPEYLRGAHHWLILHGRYTCLARSPKCGLCAIRDICLYPEKSPASSTASRNAAAIKGAASGAKDKKK